jgi:hypothetical protein
MEEVVVLKQGSIKAGNWTQRVLSLHVPLGLAAITSKDSQEDRFYQCMRVANVQIWPQYKEKHVKEGFQSQQAKLTIRMKGLPARIGFREVQTPTGPERIYRFTRPGPGAEHLTWMLRFHSFADLEKTVRFLQSMKVGDTVASSTRPPSVPGDLGGEGEEVKQEVDTVAITSMIAGDVDEQLRAICGPTQGKASAATGYATL